MSAIKWDDPCGIVGNHSFGTHRYVYGEFGPFHIHAHAHESDGAGWQAWRKDGMYFVLSASLKGQTYTLDETKDSVESTLREMRDLLNEHFGPVLRWTRDAAYPSMRVAKLEKWRLVVEEHSKWWGLFVGEPGNLTRVAWDKASDPDAAQLAAEAALRALGVTFRTDTESDAATDLVMEPVPTLRGRVVAQWRANLLGDDVLSTPTIVARVAESTLGFRVSIDVRGSNICVGTTAARQHGRSYAERVIRELVAPFGGELVVEGEP